MSYSVKEAAELLGIPAHTIRYYDKEGLLPFVERDQYGNRMLEQQDLDWMKLMTCFRATGMSISSLRRIVELAVQGDSTLDERMAILENHKQELYKKQRELDEAFAAVNHKLSVYGLRKKNKSAPLIGRMDGKAMDSMDSLGSRGPTGPN